MSKVISISNQEDWNTMSLLKGSLGYYKENNNSGKFSKAIEREEDLYFSYLKKYV